MARRFKDMTGQRFERLICITPLGSTSTGMMWECLCDCGNLTKVIRGNLLSGNVKSCGCLREEKNKNNNYGFKHGRTSKIDGKSNRIGTYSSWEAMNARCNNPNYIYYKDYGGRGITICNRWLEFENFLWDMGERPIGKTLDRINVNGNYEKSNCKWSTPSEQNNNKRSKL
jgi:hypothetical protein